jgi:hypothetical protein
VEGVDLPVPRIARATALVLGRTGGADLSPVAQANAILKPSHPLAPDFPSPPAGGEGAAAPGEYSDLLTVRQLSDLIRFLDGRRQIRSAGAPR